MFLFSVCLLFFGKWLHRSQEHSRAITVHFCLVNIQCYQFLLLQYSSDMAHRLWLSICLSMFVCPSYRSFFLCLDMYLRVLLLNLITVHRTIHLTFYIPICYLSVCWNIRFILLRWKQEELRMVECLRVLKRHTYPLSLGNKFTYSFNKYNDNITEVSVTLWSPTIIVKLPGFDKQDKESCFIF